jgi:hypothetical protein
MKCRETCQRTGLALWDWSDARIGARGHCGDCPNLGDLTSRLVRVIDQWHDEHPDMTYFELATAIESINRLLRDLRKKQHDRTG